MNTETKRPITFIPDAAKSKWDDIEVMPVFEDSNGNCEPCEPEQANLYSVYLHQVTGGVQCIADLPTEKEANELAELLKTAIGSHANNRLSVATGTVNEYYGIAMQLSDDEYSMCCLLQIGTGNTKETSRLVERWFPYSAMKQIITNKIDDEFYVSPEQYFKVKITEGVNSIAYEFYQQEETAELDSLFEKPNYFEGLDTSFLTEG